MAICHEASSAQNNMAAQAALQGDKSKAGTIVRIPAGGVEALVTDAVAKPSSNHRARTP
jgi:hypothetical protein